MGGGGGGCIPRYTCTCARTHSVIAQELCERRGGRPRLPFRNSPYGLCGRKATPKSRGQEPCQRRGGYPGLLVPDSPYGHCGRKATLRK